jgi:hypothetical protein
MIVCLLGISESPNKYPHMKVIALIFYLGLLTSYCLNFTKSLNTFLKKTVKDIIEKKFPVPTEGLSRKDVQTFK